MGISTQDADILLLNVDNRCKTTDVENQIKPDMSLSTNTVIIECCKVVNDAHVPSISSGSPLAQTSQANLLKSYYIQTIQKC